MVKTVYYTLAIVAVLVVGLLAAPLFIDVNTYKSKIEKMVKDQTGRTLRIGNIEASLFPWVGVELKDVHLANRSGFSQRDFLSIERLHVKLALMPLLSKKVEIEHFELVSPLLYLEQRESGQNNWQDLMADPESVAGLKPAVYIVNEEQLLHLSNDDGAVVAVAPDTSAAVSAAPMLAALQAESLSLMGGQVTWVDGGAAAVVLSDLDVMLDDVQLDRPVKISVSGQLSGNAFALDARVGPIGDLARINPATIPVQGHFKAVQVQLKDFQHFIASWPQQLGDVATASMGISLNMEQRPDGIRLAEGELHLKAAHELGFVWKIEMPDSNQLKINRASVVVNGQRVLHAKGVLNHLSSNPTFHLRLDGEPVARTWLQTFVPDLKAMYADHPSAWKSVQFNAVLVGDAKKVRINDLQLKLDQELLKVSGDVIYAGPDIRLRMGANQLHLDGWIPQGKDSNLAANTMFEGWSLIRSAIAAVAEKQAVEPDLRFLRSWKVAAQFKVKKLFLRGLEMGDFAVNINGDHGRFNMKPLSFKLAGGHVTETASLNVTTYPAKWRESVHITGVQAGPLLSVLADMDVLTGTMDMDTKLHASGLTPGAVNTLNGSGTVLFENGKLKGFDIAGALRKFTQPGVQQQGPKETDFAQLSGSFVVRNGIAHNQDLFMASPLLRVTGKGLVNLVQKTLDYQVTPRVVASLKGQGGNVLRPGLSIPLHIYGPFDALKVKPVINAKTLLQNAPALLNKGALGKFLRGKQGNPPAPAQQGTKQVQPVSPERQLLKGLGGLIPGF